MQAESFNKTRSAVDQAQQWVNNTVGVILPVDRGNAVIEN